MALHDLMYDDRLEMLKWVSERNLHVPLSDLAFMLDIGNDELSEGGNVPKGNVCDLHID